MDPAREFDFWLGEWKAEWRDESREPQRGTNCVSLLYDGKVVAEEFDAPGFAGKSFSVYDRGAERWKQTWVDSEGNYLDFCGRFADGTMDLRRTVTRNGDSFVSRMRWFDIGADAFRWTWERSADDWNWTVLWAIDYSRA